MIQSHLIINMCSRKQFLWSLSKMAVSAIQPTQSRIPFPFSLMSSMQSPIGTYNADHTANLQIFGFRGYVCDKCLTAEAHYVAFPNAEGQGRIQAGHFCDPAKAAAASGLVDRYGMIRSLQDKIPTLIKQKVNSRKGNNNHLVALSLSNPKEDTINCLIQQTLQNRKSPFHIQNKHTLI